MKLKNIFGKAPGRKRLLTLCAVLIIAAAAAINLILKDVGLKNSVFIDLTPEGLYTVSDAMKEECSFLSDMDPDSVKITFCADPDTLTSNQGTRVVYFMSLQLQKLFPAVTVETINAEYNKTAFSKYMPTRFTEISWNDVIISYQDRYRRFNAEEFWTIMSSGEYWSYNGEYKMTTAFLSLVTTGKTSVYFETGYGGKYYDAGDPESEMSQELYEFYCLLGDLGYNVKTFNIKESEIPDDCAMLILAGPTSDFTYDSGRLDDITYVSDIEKIDRYLINRNGSLMVFRDAAAGDLPELYGFLEEWGIEFVDSTVVDSSSSLADQSMSGTGILAQYNTNPESFAATVYEDIASISSSPRVVVPSSGFVRNPRPSDEHTVSGVTSTMLYYNSFLSTTADARAYAGNSVSGEVVGEGVMDLAAVAVRTYVDSETSNYQYSYVFGCASMDVISSEYIGDPSYANYDVLYSLTGIIARSDIYASSDLGGLNLNSPNMGGKELVDESIGTENRNIYDSSNNIAGVKHGLTTAPKVIYIVIAMLIPVSVAIVGAVVCIKRKNR